MCTLHHASRAGYILDAFLLYEDAERHCVQRTPAGHLVPASDVSASHVVHL